MRAWLLPVALVALASLSPATVGAPLVPDALHGFGEASWFEVRAVGLALEGGAHEWTDVCAECYIRFSTPGGAFTLVDASNPEGAVTELTPGLYELREFRGLYMFTQASPGAFSLQVHGLGKVLKLG